jgi:HAE1 family hydrophobic/amphiphilic exporter-1
MKLAELSVKRPVTTAMIYIAMVVLGLVSLPMLGVDLMPDIEIPAVSVITGYEGAGPEEIETLITEPMEESLSTISGVSEVISLSKEGISAVTLRFDWGEKIDEAINEVRDKVDLARMRLPDEAEKPVIVKFDVAMAPILVIAITAEENYPNLQKIVKDRIIDPVKRIKGVAAATPHGGLERQIRVDIDRDRMIALGISYEQVKAALAAQNMSIPGGNIRTGYKDYLLRTPEEFTSAEEAGEVIIAQRNAIPIKLKDVAAVYDAFKERTYDGRINGLRGMAVMIMKQSGENTVNVARRVVAELEVLKKDLPPDVKPIIVMDNSEFILASVKNLRDSALWGCFFVFLVILFFTLSLRASAIVAVSIPISLIVTFLLMRLAGYTINTTSLASLAVAVGMVVDNAIVVVDNVYRHRQRGQRAEEAAIFGTQEVGVAVMASTLTTVAIFAPIIFVGGITAIIFGQFASIMTMALMVSLFTAIMLVPMLCSKFLIIHGTRPSRPTFSYLYDLGEKLLIGLENGYIRFLKWSLNNKKTVFAVCVLLLVWSVGLVKFVGTEFFPEEDQNRLIVNFELPIGTRYERTGEVAVQIEKIIRENVPELKDLFIRWGVFGSGEAGQFATEEESYKGLAYVSLVPKEQRSASPGRIIERLRKITDRIPGAVTRYSAEDPLLGMMFGSGRNLAVEIYGHSMDDARKYAEAVKNALASVQGVTDIEISRQEEKPELKVVVDRDKASRLGLDVRTIGKTIETFFAGTTASKFREAGDEYDIEVRLQLQDRNRIEDLRDVMIDAPAGGQVHLADISDIQVGYGPTKIERKDQARYITVSADVRGRDLGSAVADARQAIDKIQAPAGFTYKFGGAEKEKEDAFNLLIAATVLGMVLVYMVMASQFESFRDPFIIFLSVPFGFVGVIISLALAGFTMNVVTFIALILLVGIVVNNGIVLISYIGILRRRGFDLQSAIIEGGRNRLRPVLSTTITTLLGLTPLMLSRGSGSEVWVPFAVTSIGGLSLGTVITLVLMPALYSVFESRKKNSQLVTAQAGAVVGKVQV